MDMNTSTDTKNSNQYSSDSLNENHSETSTNEFRTTQKLVKIIVGLVLFSLFLWSFLSITIQVFNPEKAPPVKTTHN
ncbi:MAG: hypothetical protein PF689_09720 [Deltaproteobacteria bacterium]|nr:hypothetical protein [Deltaproteobacteria bacterium]